MRLQHLDADGDDVDDGDDEMVMLVPYDDDDDDLMLDDDGDHNDYDLYADFQVHVIHHRMEPLYLLFVTLYDTIDDDYRVLFGQDVFDVGEDDDDDDDDHYYDQQLIHLYCLLLMLITLMVAVVTL